MSGDASNGASGVVPANPRARRTSDTQGDPLDGPLDGYVVGPDGDFAWTAPDGEVCQFATDETPDVGVQLLGRRLHETMLHWETADRHPSLHDAMLEWPAIWICARRRCSPRPCRKVQGNARLASGDLAEEIERL